MNANEERLETAPAASLEEMLQAARRVLKPLASLQLTVVLFILGTILVFFGTVAMMTKGLWTVVDEYFRSGFVWIPIDLVRRFGTVFFDLPKDGSPWRGSFPFPGGWSIGFVMLANLVAAHLVRFKLSWKRSGIIITHLGVIVLMLGELVTGMYAVESTMTMRIGETSSYVDVTRDYEIVVTETGDPAFDAITTIPHQYFTRPGRIDIPDAPFTIQVSECWVNTGEKMLEEPPPPNMPDVFPVRLPGGATLWMKLAPRAESAGVDGNAHADIPSVRVKILDKNDGGELGSFLLSLWAYENFELNRRVYQFPPTAVAIGGKAYTFLLRNKRVEKPYSVKLLQFEHGRYPGTDIPKDFASTVTVTEKATGDSHEVRIWMNNPLRHDDDSLYQNAVMYSDSGTVLQVVKNPGRLMPYISCTMVMLGMLIHFGMKLRTFLSKVRAAR